MTRARERQNDEAEDRRRAAPEPPAHELLALQRRLGNQAVQRLIGATGGLARKGAPTPTRTAIAPISHIYGVTDAAEWKQKLDDNESVIPLYAEIAWLLNATVIEDVAGVGPENVNRAARATPDELCPGLNFVANLEVAGQSGYLYDGRYTGILPDTRDGPDPSVAVLLGPRAFVAGNKARTIAVLRHELEHAAHNQMAVTWLKRWRADPKAARQPFRAWLRTKGIAAADLALIHERLGGTKINTELLAHLEGYIAGFPVETEAAARTSHAAFFELDDVSAKWEHADPDVRKDAAARLREFKARLKGDRLARFLADMRRLKTENAKLAGLVDPLL